VFTLAHISDLHINPLGRPTWRDLMNKRITGYANWLRARRKVHDTAWLDLILADITAHKPDHIAVTGDVSHIGLTAEFDAAKTMLTALGSPACVSFVPGNHDIYVPGTMDAVSAKLGSYMIGDDGIQRFPYLRIRGGIGLIGMNSAVPTPPFDATGLVGEAQCEAAEMLLHYAAGLGLTRVIMIHHPPHSGGAKPGRELRDAPIFEAMLARAGAELVLHGHNHTTTLAWGRAPEGQSAVPIIGVASASLNPAFGHGEPAAWHLISIAGDRHPRQITIRKRVMQSDGTIGEGEAINLAT
jgi:3',5'-cyclic AMP phosphodiesterase CpdA